MATKNTIQGGAYEFACLETLFYQLEKLRRISVVKDKRYFIAEKAWNNISSNQQDVYKTSATTAVEELFLMEPNITEGTDVLELRLQKDQKGEDGDVRDILIIRDSINWEIGLSIKHNHFAVKHSRLATNLDFCNSWFNFPCSQTYWDEINPIFTRLSELKETNTKFSDIADKEIVIYKPILEAFCNELMLQNKHHKEMPALLVEYLLGRFDFYKVVSVDSKKLTMIQAYNLHGTLNRKSKNNRPKTIVPIAELPTRIILIGFKPNSLTTIELFMDNGWSFTFRIHNAATICEPSLKFDIQIVGMPTNIICIRTSWKIR